MSVREERVWAGSQTSFEAALAAETRIAAGDHREPPEPRDGPRLLQVSDGIGLITIKGPLMNSDSPMLEMFGATGYPEIREALVAAVNDPEVKEILLDCDSGGGAVSGCDDTGNLIRAVHAVKPVTAYGDTMFSAMYWLASSAGLVFSGKASVVGSIGVKATFREYSKANEKEGVTVTVIRSGKYKALADSNEPLTDAARAQIQATTDAAYQVFVEHVAEMRGRTYAYADKVMADGQEFIGQAAVDVGLTDGITTFDAVVGGLRRKILASSTKSMDNRGNNSVPLSGEHAYISGETGMAKKALTEQDIAALASGVKIDAAIGAGSGDAPAAEAAKVEGAPAAEAEAAKVEGAEGAPAAEVEAAKVEGAEDAQKPDTIDATVQLLNSQLQAKDDALLKASLKVAKLEEQLAAAEGTVDPLVKIAVRAVSNMKVAMNHSVATLDGMSAAQIVAEYAQASTQFQSQYPVGGVSAVVGDSTATQAQIDPRHLARVNAARFSK